MSNSACNHTGDQTNQTPCIQSSDYFNHSYDNRPNCSPLNQITITNYQFKISLLMSIKNVINYEMLDFDPLYYLIAHLMTKLLQKYQK